MRIDQARRDRAFALNSAAGFATPFAMMGIGYLVWSSLEEQGELVAFAAGAGAAFSFLAVTSVAFTKVIAPRLVNWYLRED